MTVDFSLAYQAESLSRKGIRGKELGVRLQVSTSEANRLAGIGAVKRRIEESRLTAAEHRLIQCLTDEKIFLLRQGETRSPKSKNVSWRAGKSPSWATATAQKRIFDERWDEKEGRNVRGMGLVHVAGNGYIWLTPSGWALAHALNMVPND